MGLSLNVPYLSDQLPVSVQFIVLSLILSFAYFVYSTLTSERPLKQFPIVALSEEGLSPKASWFQRGSETILKGVEKYDGPFQVITGTGAKIVLPNRFADELKNHPGLSFSKAFSKDFFANYPGFESFKQSFNEDHDRFVPDIVRVKLTQSLGLITNDLVDETTAGIRDIFDDGAEWQSVLLKQKLMHLVARLSSRVFLGKPLCRNERWLEISKNYTMDAFASARRLRGIPAIVRPFVHWFLPPCIQLRKDVRDAQKLILPEVERRKQRTQKALEAGQKPPKTADTIGWMYELARERRRDDVDYVNYQLSLSLAAIHTTTEAITQALLDVCAHPEFIAPLREEIVNVIGKEGWSKTALYKLRFMDSFLKESQRYHPNAVSMNRMVVSDIELSNGSVLPAGSRIMVANKFWDPSVYANPSKFDPYRFIREREKPQQQNTWQHVTVNPDHMGFGYGEHACPGRFFASNEIKVALCQLLLKYDWQPAEGKAPSEWKFEAGTMALADCKAQMRRRKEEIDLDVELEED